MSTQDGKEREAQRRQRESREAIERGHGPLSQVNWHESTLLVKHEAPHEPVSADDVGEYLDQVQEYACAVLCDLGIENPVVPLQHRRLYDAEHHESTADAYVAARLLENVDFLRRLRDLEAPTRGQVDCMLWMMAQISALTSMPHLRVPMLQRGKAEKQRAERQRNAEIRRLHAEGEKIVTLAAQFDLTERRIEQIVAKK